MLVAWLILVVLSFSRCASLPQETDLPARRIATMPGPEDMDLLSLGGSQSLLISCDYRRCEEDCPNGEILRYHLESGKMDTLKRIGEPVGMPFHPHGIDLVVTSAATYLFVVNHDKAAKVERISKYRLEEDALIFEQNFENAHFRSPNAVYADSDGRFWVSNDRWDKESLSELLLSKKKSTLVRVEGDGQAELVGEKVAFGNGVVRKTDAFFQAATRENAIFKYDITEKGLENRTKWAELTGPDNLRFDGESILVACHLRGMKFMRHAQNPKNASPTAVYRIPIDTGKPELLYFDRGKEISAGSTAIRVGSKLYISQVFEPWILEVDFGEAAP